MAGVVAKSYSEALFSLSLEEQKLDIYKEQLCFMQAQIKENPDFMRILTHPKLHKDEKKKVIEDVFGKDIDHTIVNFMKLLVDKSRFQNLGDIIKEFIKLYNKENNIEVAYVHSAKELSKEEIKRLQDTLEKKLTKKVDMRFFIDPDLIAGMRIRINDAVLDNSAKNRIERLKTMAQDAELVQENRGECR